MNIKKNIFDHGKKIRLRVDFENLWEVAVFRCIISESDPCEHKIKDSKMCLMCPSLVSMMHGNANIVEGCLDKETVDYLFHKDGTSRTVEERDVWLKSHQKARKEQ